jgi:hypothetical protein
MQKCDVTNKSGYESLLKIYRETDQSQEKVRVIGQPIHILYFHYMGELKSYDFCLKR